MMLGKIIGTIGFAFIPENLELALADAITDPIKAHIDGFGSLLLDGVSCNATGSIVVGRHRSGWLGMAHFFKCNSERTGFLPL